MAQKTAVQKEYTGIKRSTLRLLGIILLALGAMGRGVLENRVLGVNMSDTAQLMTMLEMDGGMAAAGTALLFEAMESCAVPIFAVLLVDGFRRTKNYRSYLLRVLLLAVVSEVPYNFAMTGQVLDMTSQNPVFASVICLIMLYLYNTYQGTEFGKVLIKLVVAAAAILWSLMFRVNYGVILPVIVTILWIFRERPSLRSFLGAAAAVCFCVGNPLYMFSPFGFLAAHFYRGEEGISIGRLPYLMYPLVLILVGAAGILLFG